MAKTKQKPAPRAAELSRRGAAAMAHQTRGMSRTVESRKVYDRKRQGKGWAHE